MPCGVCCHCATCIHLSLSARGFSQASKEGSACIVQDRLKVQRTNTSTQLSAGIRQQSVDGRGMLKLLASWVGQLRDPSPCVQQSLEDGAQLVTLVTCSLLGFFLSPYHSLTVFLVFCCATLLSTKQWNASLQKEPTKGHP